MTTPLIIRRADGREIAPPFLARVHAGRIELSAPAFATIATRRALGWRAVYRGQKLADAGILAGQKDIAFSFPLTARLRVSLTGQSWRIEMPAPPRARRFRRQTIYKRVAFFFALSLFLHASLLTLSRARQSSPGAEAPSLTVKHALPVSGGVAAPPVAQPFGGISFSRFLDRWIDRTGTAAERLAHLLKRAGSFGDTKVGGKVAAATAGGARVDVVGSGDGGLGERVEASYQAAAPASAKQKFASPAGDAGPLRAQLQTLHERWQKIYGEALVADPKLAVTVAYQLKVGGDGRLQLIDFRPKGSFRPEGLRVLKDGMAEAVGGTRVDVKYAGTVLRGENVFVH